MRQKTWVEEYLDRAAAIPQDDLIFSSEPVDLANDIIVGEMTLDHQRLYTILQQLSEQADQAQLKVKYLKRGDDRAQLRMECARLNDQARIMQEVFWYEIRNHFNLWDRPLVGIREAVNVVWQKRPPPGSSLQGLIHFGLPPEEPS